MGHFCDFYVIFRVCVPMPNIKVARFIANGVQLDAGYNIQCFICDQCIKFYYLYFLGVVFIVKHHNILNWPCYRRLHIDNHFSISSQYHHKILITWTLGKSLFLDGVHLPEIPWLASIQNDPTLVWTALRIVGLCYWFGLFSHISK